MNIDVFVSKEDMQNLETLDGFILSADGGRIETSYCEYINFKYQPERLKRSDAEMQNDSPNNANT